MKTKLKPETIADLINQANATCAAIARILDATTESEEDSATISAMARASVLTQTLSAIVGAD